MPFLCTDKPQKPEQGKAARVQPVLDDVTVQCAQNHFSGWSLSKLPKRHKLEKLQNVKMSNLGLPDSR